MRTCEEVVGRGVFEAFPDNPGDATIAGVNTLRASLERVLATRQPDRLPGLKYDIARPDGTFEERWWSPVNSAVLDEHGAVEAIIHNANDVTAEHRAEAALRASEARQAFLLRLGDALRPLDAAAEIQGEATRLLREHLAAGWCYYVEWDEAAARGVVLRDATRGGLPSLAGAHDVSAVPAFLDTLREGGVLNVCDYASFDGLGPGLRARDTALGFRSMLVATLVKQGRLVASLIVGDTEVRDWSGGAEALLTDIAERTWAAVERARAEAALRESEEMFRTLFESIDEGFCILEMIEDDQGNAVDFRYIEANEEHDRQAGLGYVVGKLASEVVPNAEAYWFETFGEVARTGEPKRYENYNQDRSEEHTSELQSRQYIVCRLLLEKKKK